MPEKTEKPSQRKLKKAREEGKVVKSSELSASLLLLSGLALLWFFGKSLKTGLVNIFKEVFGNLHTLELDEVAGKIFPWIAVPLLWIMGGLVLIALLTHFVQTGWVWKRPRKHQKGKSHILMTSLKMIVIGLIGYLSLQNLSPSLGFSHLFEHIFFMLLKLALVLLLIGVGDWFYQKWQYEKQMRMTRQEVKEEKGESEGPQETKSKMRRR
jgi:flagellar biosynthesis protein FlhB